MADVAFENLIKPSCYLVDLVMHCVVAHILWRPQLALVLLRSIGQCGLAVLTHKPRGVVVLLARAELLASLVASMAGGL